MKPLFLIAAIAIAALVLSSSGDEPTSAKPAVCPECPGGVCPLPSDRFQGAVPPLAGSLSLQEKIPVPVQVNPVPIFTLAKHQKSLIKPEAKQPADKVHEGPKGWRLRLLYTKGDKQAIKFQHWFENRMPVISKKYGFQAIASDEPKFDVWREAGYSAEKPMLVLACPDDVVALKTTDIPTDIEELRSLIRASAEKFATHSK